jgi:hypothetical protein
MEEKHIEVFEEQTEEFTVHKQYNYINDQSSNNSTVDGNNNKNDYGLKGTFGESDANQVSIKGIIQHVVKCLRRLINL